jgi:hypothetical protein
MIGTVRIVRYWQNFKQADKRLITYKSRTRIWRTLDGKRFFIGNFKGDIC